MPGDSRTVAVAVAVASAGTSCRSVDVTFAICVIIPGTMGVTTKSTLASAPGFIVPSWNRAVPAIHSVVPTLAVLVSKTRAGPIGTLKTTLVAGKGPVFETIKPKVSASPVTTVGVVVASSKLRLTDGTTDTD